MSPLLAGMANFFLGWFTNPHRPHFPVHDVFRDFTGSFFSLRYFTCSTRAAADALVVASFADFSCSADMSCTLHSCIALSMVRSASCNSLPLKLLFLTPIMILSLIRPSLSSPYSQLAANDNVLFIDVLINGFGVILRSRIEFATFECDVTSRITGRFKCLYQWCYLAFVTFLNGERVKNVNAFFENGIEQNGAFARRVFSLSPDAFRLYV